MCARKPVSLHTSIEPVVSGVGVLVGVFVGPPGVFVGVFVGCSHGFDWSPACGKFGPNSDVLPNFPVAVIVSCAPVRPHGTSNWNWPAPFAVADPM